VDEARAGREEGCRCADARAFGEMLEQYRGALVSVGLDRTGRWEVAEEVAQEAIVTAWERRGELRRPAAAGSWLYRIAVNCCVAWQRREGRDEALGSPGRGGPCRQPPVVEEMLRREAVREARRALEAVPAANRIALLMHVSGYSYEEIGGFVGVPASTVRGRIARTRSRLRKEVARRLGLALARKEKQSDESI
jgi:RNA polymerase sigma-70 factor (ECF subfamily)